MNKQHLNARARRQLEGSGVRTPQPRPGQGYVIADVPYIYYAASLAWMQENEDSIYSVGL